MTHLFPQENDEIDEKLRKFVQYISLLYTCLLPNKYSY